MPRMLARRNRYGLPDDHLGRPRVDRRLQDDAEAVDRTRDLPRGELDTGQLAGKQVRAGPERGRVRGLPGERDDGVAVDIALHLDDKRARGQRTAGPEADDGPRRS